MKEHPFEENHTKHSAPVAGPGSLAGENNPGEIVLKLPSAGFVPPACLKGCISYKGNDSWQKLCLYSMFKLLIIAASNPERDSPFKHKVVITKTLGETTPDQSYGSLNLISSRK